MKQALPPRESKLASFLRFLIYVTAFIPLVIFSNYISPFHFGKVIVFRSIVEIMAVFYIALVLYNRSYAPRTNKIFWSLFAFSSAFSIATIFSVIPYVSFWGTLERMGGLWTFWHYFVYFVILTAVFRTPQHWKKLLDTIILVGILSAIYGFFQRTNITFFIGSGGRERIFGTIGNPALFAGYQIVTLFLALTLFFRKGNSTKYRIFLGMAVALNTLAVLMTVVRGSILAIVVGFALFALMYSWVFGSSRAKKALFALIVFAVVFVALGISLRGSDFVKSSPYLTRVTDFSISTFTVQTRLWTWQAGLEGWAETPKTVLVGWGPDNFNIPFSRHFNPKFFTGPGAETLFDRAHNMFVEVLVTMGLLGLLAYLAIFVSAFMALRTMIKSHSDNAIYGIGFSSLLVAYMIHNSFIFDTSANFLAFFTILGFISYLIFANGDTGFNAASYNKNKAAKNALVWLLGIGAIILIYKTDVLPSRANYATTRAIVQGWQDQLAKTDAEKTQVFNDTVEKYKLALAYDVPGKYDYRHRFAQYVIDYSAGLKLSPALIGILETAEDFVKMNAAENPQDYLPFLYLSRINTTLGREDPKSPYNDIALEYSNKALLLAPKFVRTYFEIAQAYLNKNDAEKAIEYFQKAADLNPNVGISYWYIGSVEVARGNIPKGLTLIEEALDKGYSPEPAEYIRLAAIYNKFGNPKKVVEIYEKLITASPDNVQYHASLASAYAKAGRIDDAVAEAKVAAQLDPSFEKEAQAFVESIGRKW